MFKIITYLAKRYNLFRTIFLGTSDFLIIFFSLIAGIFLYTRLIPIPYSWKIISEIIALSFIIRLILFFVFKIYNISFQHVSHLYILKISSIIMLHYAFSYLILKSIWPSFWFGFISVLSAITDIIISVIFRFIPLVYYEICNKISNGDRNCLIFGSGETGQSLAQALIKHRHNVKGFIDDDPHCKNKIIHGIRVLGQLNDLERLLTQLKVEILIIAIPSLSGERIKTIRKLCSKFNIEVKIVSSLYGNSKSIEIESSIQQINYEDLLRRSIKKENFLNYNAFFRSKTIWITGAGGSVGTELVRQLLSLEVSKVIALDHSELNLFNLQNNISSSQKKKLVLKLIDLKNSTLLEKLSLENIPHMVFHAAAYKHVPMVQENACEGVLNNLLCLENIYNLSCRHHIQKFIFISSDKAVKSQSIMGMTKKLGELYVQIMGDRTGLNACSVRFGNIIGSSGSLIPTIINQVQKNMPITITHPNASRFFMLVSEAAQLILKASILSEKGEIFILDMKDPINIMDIVQDIAAFYNKELKKDIPIDYIGLRPGEKLTEKLFDENTEHLIPKEEMYIAKQKNAFPLNNDFLSDYRQIIDYAQHGFEIEMMKLIEKYTQQNIHPHLFQETKGEELHPLCTS